MTVRTQIYLPESLHARLKNRGQILNKSMADQIREAVERYLATEAAPQAMPDDPIWSLPDLAIHTPAGSPSDAAVKHDRYLYRPGTKSKARGRAKESRARRR